MELDEWRELCEGSVNYLVYGNIHHLLGCLYSSFLHAAVYILLFQLAIYLDEHLARLSCTDEGVVARHPKPRYAVAIFGSKT